MNSKPVQGLLFQKFRHEMRGVPVGYNDDAKRRNTHPMLLPKIKNEMITTPENVLLKEIAVLVPEKHNTTMEKIPTKGISWSSYRKSISPRTGATVHQELAQRQNKGVCWERVQMDQGLDPSGRLEGPNV